MQTINANKAILLRKATVATHWDCSVRTIERYLEKKGGLESVVLPGGGIRVLLSSVEKLEKKIKIIRKTPTNTDKTA